MRAPDWQSFGGGGGGQKEEAQCRENKMMMMTRRRKERRWLQRVAIFLTCSRAQTGNCLHFGPTSSAALIPNGGPNAAHTNRGNTRAATAAEGRQAREQLKQQRRQAGRRSTKRAAERDCVCLSEAEIVFGVVLSLVGAETSLRAMLRLVCEACALSQCSNAAPRWLVCSALLCLSARRSLQQTACQAARWRPPVSRGLRLSLSLAVSFSPAPDCLPAGQ